MKRILILNNAERFVKWVNETFPKDAGDDRTDVQYAAWAICLQEAHAIFDAYTTKDMASMLMEGVTPYASLEAIQSWLDTYYDELNTAIDEGDVKLDVDFCLDEETADEYGLGNLAEMIREDYAPNCGQDNDDEED